MLFALGAMIWPGLGNACSDVQVQVLGSGGPELNDGRRSSAYLLWHRRTARVLLDAGTGSSIAFGEAGAEFADLDAILLTHLHTDHAADLPAFIKGSFFTARDRELLLAGPSGNDRMPATTTFAKALFGADGAFRYLRSYLDGTEAYRLVPRNMPADGAGEVPGEGWHASSLPVRHGPIPALAWRLTVGGCVIVYAGDMARAPDGFTAFAADADLLLLHSAIPEDAGPVARSLHMRPGELAALAQQTAPRHLLISHFMKRSEQVPKESFSGLNMPVTLAADGMTLSLE